MKCSATEGVESIEASKREYDRRYYAANRERICKRGAEYRVQNAEEIKRRKRLWYEQNKEKVLVRSSQRYAAKRVEILAKEKRRYSESPEVRSRIKERSKLYRTELRKDAARLRDYWARRTNEDRVRREKLSNCYVNTVLRARGWRLADITPEIRELMRSILVMKREIRNGHQQPV